MISVTSDYLNQLNNNSLSPKSKIVVDGVEYLGNIIKDTPKTKHSATKPFGTFPAKTLSFSIYNLNNDVDFEGKEIEAYKGLVIDGEVEYVKQGIFIPTAENISTNITERTVSFSDVQDRTQLLMDKYESNLEWSNGETHSGLEIIQEICTKKNITLKTTNFAFANYQFKQPNFSETITNRGVIAAMGEIGGETAIFNNNGELEIKSQASTEHTIQRKRYEKLSYEKNITFNTVALGREGTNNDIVYPYEIETTRVEAKILDNPFVDLYREEMIEEVASHIIGFSYIPFNIENIVDGYIYELNDAVEVVDKNNNTFEAIMLSIESNSRIKSNISAPQPEETKTNYNLAGSNKENISQVKLDVDHINQEVTALAEKVEIVSETIDSAGSLTLKNAFNGTLHQLSIKGQMNLLFPTTESTYGYSLVPHDNLVPKNGLSPSNPVPYGNEILYPSSSLYTKSNILLVDDTEYKLDIDFLNYMSKETCDEFVYEDNKCKIIRRVGIDSLGQKYKLAEEAIELRDDVDIQVKSNSIIKMKNFDDMFYSSTYLIQNEYTDTFAVDVDIKSEIKQIADSINLEVSKKVNENEIISKINQSAEKISINADKISLDGTNINLTSENITVSSKGLEIDENGKITITDEQESGPANLEIIYGKDEEYQRITQYKANGIFSTYGVTDEYGFNLTYTLTKPTFTLFDFENSEFTTIKSSGITTPKLTQTSLATEKKNFEKFENGLDIVNKTDIYKYNLKFETDEDKKHIGFIIGKNHNYSEEITSNDNKGVDLYSMISVAYKAIQEQQEQIEILKKEIKLLKKGE